jgi:hypothetical protein
VLDQVQWTTGKRFTVMDVKPLPEGQTFVLYQVILIPQDRPEALFRFRCETHTPVGFGVAQPLRSASHRLKG